MEEKKTNQLPAGDAEPECCRRKATPRGESALQAFGYLVLQNHLETCVVEEIQKGNTQIVEEALELIRKLK